MGQCLEPTSLHDAMKDRGPEDHEEAAAVMQERRAQLSGHEGILATKEQTGIGGGNDRQDWGALTD